MIKSAQQRLSDHLERKMPDSDNSVKVDTLLLGEVCIFLCGEINRLEERIRDLEGFNE